LGRLIQLRHDQKSVGSFRATQRYQGAGQGGTRTRAWDGEKLADFLWAGLGPKLSTMIDDLELDVVVAKSYDIRFSWKPESIGELRSAIGELIATVMEDVEVDDFLSE